MIARIWNGVATAEGADGYARHFRESVLPSLRALPGEDHTTAVVEPGARAVLTSYDSTVAHYEIAESA